MIKEVAFGIANRHHFMPEDEIDKWKGTKDTYTSLYSYDDYVKEYYNNKKTLAGFDGKIYMPKEFYFDVDGDSSERARQLTIGLCEYLKELDVTYRLYFSGTGFHVGVSQGIFKWEPSKDLHLRVKDCLTSNGVFDFADSSVVDKTRIIRLTNTRNSKSGLFKVPISESELHTDIENIKKLAVYMRLPDWYLVENEEETPVFDVMKRVKVAQTTPIVTSSRTGDSFYYPCIQKMLEGTSYGSRHNVSLRVAAWLKDRYPEHVVRVIMEDFRQRVDMKDKPFPKKEMDTIVENCYTGHNGKGYRYGCSDSVMDHFCNSSCTLYSSKKSQKAITAENMEDLLIDFLDSNIEPINIGEIYNQDFPIYPGEVLVIQAPPKSMKTMLIQNWLCALKRPTYFLELEMSSRQIYMRFLQIQLGMTEQEILSYYRDKKNGLHKDFEWLTFDTNNCHPFEIEKRISSLAQKPEIVVVDHMGLLNTNHKDANMKMEEISEGLRTLAIRQNVVVITVSEISKGAIRENNVSDISASRGSFRIAYSANKILSLHADRDKMDGNRIKRIRVRTVANREKEQLNVSLRLDGLNMIKEGY
tara:strand:+ start:3022 stop:4776 length:1755 start_codon:yes stop_codon:yes gene_type:complete